MGSTGVLLFNPEPAIILAYDYMKAEYSVKTNADEMLGVNPKEMEEKVFRVGKQFLIKASAVCEKHDLVKLIDFAPEVRI